MAGSSREVQNPEEGFDRDTRTMVFTIGPLVSRRFALDQRDVT
jgi:hypothetical protein